MALKHITADDIARYGVVAAPDRLTGKAQDNKAIFDRLVRELVAVAVNQVIDQTNALMTAEDVRLEQESGRIEAEAARVAAEALRAAAEEARAAAEALRDAAERERKSAEESRTRAEQGRETAETQRREAETQRQQSEEARAEEEERRSFADFLRDEAEGGRAYAETARRTAEGQRTAAETLRDSAEDARTHAEESREAGEAARIHAEQARETAEGGRTQAEQARETAEGERARAEEGRQAGETARAEEEEKRKQQEAERQAAEEARADEHTGLIAQAAGEADRAKFEADRASQIVGGDFATHLELNTGLAGKAGMTLLGPAALADQLLPGGILFVTEGNVEDYAVTLGELLAEGDKAYRGEADALGSLLTVGRAKVLGFRSNLAGDEFHAGNLSTLAQAIRGVCAAAQAGGVYVADGATAVSYRQVQYYILHGRLVSHGEACGESWSWCRDPDSEVMFLRRRLEDLQAAIGDINKVLDAVNGGAGT